MLPANRQTFGDYPAPVPGKSGAGFPLDDYSLPDLPDIYFSSLQRTWTFSTFGIVLKIPGVLNVDDQF